MYRRIALIVSVLLMLSLILTGCGKEAVSYPEQMPEDFNIRFVWAIGGENIYDSFTGQIQKDLVMDGVASAEFEPDPAERKQIYEKLRELDIASIDREMTSAVLTTTNEIIACIPLTTYEISFTMNGETFHLKGDYTAASYTRDKDAVRFMEFVDFMCQLTRQNPAYQSLPDANGAYE